MSFPSVPHFRVSSAGGVPCRSGRVQNFENDFENDSGLCYPAPTISHRTSSHRIASCRSTTTSRRALAPSPRAASG
eukprot:7655470-Alexandrium_andersonii.AAC.1